MTIQDKQINTVDADGIPLATIQGLNQKLEERVANGNCVARLLENVAEAIDSRVKKSMISHAGELNLPEV